MPLDAGANAPTGRVTPTTKAGENGKPRRSQRVRRIDGASGRGSSRARQRWRLIQAMIELAAKSGYQDVSIEKLSSGAGVSPSTFYELFGDKEELLLAAYRSCAEAIFGPMRQVLFDAEIAQVPRLALGAMLEAIAADPDAARIVFVEALGGGERMRATRTAAFQRFERRVRQYLEAMPEDTMTLDVPISAIAGALRHIVSRHLRTHAEDQLPARLDDGLAWLYSYVRPSGAPPWSTSPDALLDDGTYSEPPQTWSAERLPPGTHGLAASVIARSQRTRILYATAQVTMDRGYAATKVDDIVAAARVAKPTFYQYFEDKQHAFLEAQQFPTQHIVDRCVEAYFTVDVWPERVWRCFDVLLDLIVSNPAISHLRLVECYAAGPEAIRRAEDITRSFTMFVQEGYRYRAEASQLPRLVSEAIAGAFFEIVQRDVAEARWSVLRARLPQLTYIALAPFTGAEEAVELVQGFTARQTPTAA
jgi:AcrR family transcriptional regulator